MLIQSQWEFKAFFNSFRTNSRGVTILLNKSFECQVHNVDKDDSSNRRSLDTTIENMHLWLVHIHCPNFDTQNFYSKLMNKMDCNLNTQHIIIRRDFNLVMNRHLDSMNYKHLNNP